MLLLDCLKKSTYQPVRYVISWEKLDPGLIRVLQLPTSPTSYEIPSWKVGYRSGALKQSLRSQLRGYRKSRSSRPYSQTLQSIRYAQWWKHLRKLRVLRKRFNRAWTQALEDELT